MPLGGGDFDAIHLSEPGPNMANSAMMGPLGRHLEEKGRPLLGKMGRERMRRCATWAGAYSRAFYNYGRGPSGVARAPGNSQPLTNVVAERQVADDDSVGR